MLFRKFRQILYNKSNWNYNLHHFLISTRFTKKCVSIDSFWKLYRGDIRGMSSFVLNESSIMKLWSSWRRNYFLNTVVRRYRRDRGVREVLQRFRHTWLRPRQTLLLSATAAYKSHKDGMPPSCENNITDEEMQELLKELENVNELSKKTLFCARCGKRLVIDKKLPGIAYCSCKEPQPVDDSEGWTPYMEADDVIVWRKQYKPGQPYYAYKVYGRYKELRAQDFAAVQVDGAYRRYWDASVAALSVVERRANGLDDQTVLHWEVLWPRLFANRDYVYIRRHKEFDLNPPNTEKPKAPAPPAASDNSRPTVHAHAKRKAIEIEQQKETEKAVPVNNKVIIIASRSCKHHKVPVTKHAIRVSEFWSHMTIKSLDGIDKPGMEFVLTYYEEPAVGGMPSGVTSWVSGRAAPAFLERQRRAAADYRGWRAHRTHLDLPDYVAFSAETEASLDANAKDTIRELDMESSKLGPELEPDIKTHDRGTQTELEQRTTILAKVDAHDAGTADNVAREKDEMPSESEIKLPVSNLKSDTPIKDYTEVIEKCDEEIKSNIVIPKTNDLDVKNGREKLPKSVQDTQNVDRDTQDTTESNNGLSTQDGAKSNKTKDDGKVAQNGGEEKQDGDSKRDDETDTDEDNNSSWWRWFESIST
ncbi:uncharacterized protein LOC128682563 isoform X2 [Plodia interpunctella]|uniref:uncharacterized protein LOC128682563 isoform X2 n=1 Tax=Plodia interpunctella TaxID=58824 RepID=UPI0023680E5E|nr:uncharacterized protein LOC128682563 isoform X2 [Plodia interpunctella]